MYAFGLSRKQCGVIFANIKSGKLQLPEDFANWMYKRVADAKVFADDSHTADVFSRMREGLDEVFAGDYSAATEKLTEAYNVYHVYFKEN